MKTNMGIIDKGIRFILAIVIIILFAIKVIPNNEWWSYALLLIGLFFAITSLLGFCPLYRPLKIDTRSYEKKKADRRNNRSEHIT
ncbi:MAG TPA: DUF2892 domain-containing protein [Bacteroidales bacterium]|nr:DUF2892 domain-containing protein [Bacteroidales bacterium]